MFHKIKDYFTHEDKKLRDDRWIFLSMLVGAIGSLIAAFVLSVEAVELAKNSHAVPAATSMRCLTAELSVFILLHTCLDFPTAFWD